MRAAGGVILFRGEIRSRIRADGYRSRWSVRRDPLEGAPMPDRRDTETSLTLLERIQVNPEDPQAWRLFVERYQPQIRRWCLAWGLQDSDADDVAQDVLVKLFAALRKFRYDPTRSFRAWLKTVTQHAWSNFLAARRKDPGHNAGSVSLIADSAEAQSSLERQLEEAFDRELLDVAMHRVKSRVKPATWEAFQLTAIEGLAGVDAARKLGMPVGHVFVAKHRVQKMLQDEVRILKEGAG
jgi:RNA polymerase sigma factor (sigma-70 family)